ncbi:hypothetical protein [Ottowia sp.]|uniref:hypothetical protein n=1 Tax=Ottowia sp. TaxID=1898956 RepID=UPI002C16B0FC|nr:hypothetical protein [Ottowia sp.]HNR84365.1 hypothetical protein [Ottowia sp.]
MHPILALLLGQLSERLLVVLLLHILEQVRPLVADTNTQLDDAALDALITALKREQDGVANGRPGNGGAV